MRLLPGSAVQGESLILGKKVDALCVLHRPLAPPFRIAVECKEWSAKLTRKTCSEILSEYQLLLDRGYVDQLLLVTENDIVPNARELFCDVRFRHLTIAQLLKEAFDSGHLLSNLDRLYQQDGLDDFYQKPGGTLPDLAFCGQNFDLVYSDFMDFALDSFGRGADYDRVRQEWRKYQNSTPFDDYSARTFEQHIEARVGAPVDDLERAILDWVMDADLKVQIALLGSYGTGKSSFARRIAYRCAQMYRDSLCARMPLLIELKEFGSHQDIRGLITHELVNRHGCSNGSFEAFDAMNKSGQFVIILDGFDEMKQGMTLDSLIYNFNQLSLLCHPNSKVMLCGRPTLFESQDEQNRVLNGGR